jgi:hypothetical protein
MMDRTKPGHVKAEAWWTSTNSKATLFSITGLTVTQATASSTGDTIFNPIDATAPFDFKP